MRKIRLKKLKTADNPAFPTSEDKNLEADELAKTGKSPWVDYEIEGYIHKEPKIGFKLAIIRTNRNGKEILGFFMTSKVDSVVKTLAGTKLVFTQNSVYKLEGID